MYYAIFVPQNIELPEELSQRPSPEELVFSEIKAASDVMKLYKGSRMKTFGTRKKAIDFLTNPDKDESFIDLDSSHQDLLSSFEKLTIQQSPKASSFFSPPSPKPLTSTPDKNQAALTPSKVPVELPKPTNAADEAEPVYPSAKPAVLNLLRRDIEGGYYDAVEKTIWSNPRFLVSVCDSAIYLMAGPKYNACHIASRANKPDIMALILDTVSNFSFLRKLYPKESDANIQDRVNHLLDSYLNTPEPRLGNTPLHFACKLGHYRVVRVLLTFEGCDLSLRDAKGQTAEEAICTMYSPPKPKPTEIEHSDGDAAHEDNMKHEEDESIVDELSEIFVRNKIKNLFKRQMHLPLYRDQLKKRLMLEKRRRSRAGSQMNSDTSFSDIDDSFILNSPTK